MGLVKARNKIRNESILEQLSEKLETGELLMVEREPTRIKSSFGVAYQFQVYAQNGEQTSRQIARVQRTYDRRKAEYTII